MTETPRPHDSELDSLHPTIRHVSHPLSPISCSPCSESFSAWIPRTVVALSLWECIGLFPAVVVGVSHGSSVHLSVSGSSDPRPCDLVVGIAGLAD